MRTSNNLISKVAPLTSLFPHKSCFPNNVFAGSDFDASFGAIFTAALKPVLAASVKVALCFTLLNPLTIVAEEKVYRSIDKNGNVVFTDQVTENAEEIEIKETATYTETIPTYTPSTKPKSEDAPAGYSSLSILEPAREAAIRSNSGSLTVSYSLQPGLEPKHSTQLLMDGSPVQSSGGAGSFSLTNIDRGTHTLTVQVINEDGAVMIASDSIMITMLRYAQVRQVRPHGGR